MKYSSGLPFHNSNYKERFSFHTGFDLKIRIWRRIYLCTGILLDRLSASEKSIIPAFPGSAAGFNQVTVSQFFLEIPLRAEYRFTKNVCSPFITTGITSSVFFLQKTEFETDYVGKKSVVDKNDWYQKGDRNEVRFLYQLGFGLDARLKRLKIQVYPLYDFGFLPKYFPGGSPVYYSRIGLAVSMGYNI